MRKKINNKLNNQDSLQSKIYKDLIQSLFIALFLGYAVYIVIVSSIINFGFDNFIQQTIFFLLVTIIVIVITDIILVKSIKNHILNKFEYMEHELEEIKQGNLSKRLTIFGNDEIDKRTKFINSLLSQVEDLIEIEKRFSLIDPLTSCYNRRAFQVNLSSLISEAKRKNNSFVLAILDLDDFKKINDKFGHTVGDDVLISFVKIVKNHIREHDHIYRIGGEEFVILMKDLNQEDAIFSLERLRKNVPYELKKRVEKLESNVTFSCGCISSKKYDLSEKDVIKDMIKDADDLAYEAKRKGKNQILC